MPTETAERWVRSTRKRGVPNTWHLVIGVEAYDEDLIIMRCMKRMRRETVEEAGAPSTQGLACVLCTRYRHAKSRPPYGGIGYRPMFG